MRHNTTDFKGDVSMKTLINKLDLAIQRKRRLYYHEDETENARIQKYRATNKRLYFLKYIAIALWITLPFFEKPAWCMYSREIDWNTSEGFWYC